MTADEAFGTSRVAIVRFDRQEALMPAMAVVALLICWLHFFLKIFFLSCINLRKRDTYLKEAFLLHLQHISVHSRLAFTLPQLLVEVDWPSGAGITCPRNPLSVKRMKYKVNPHLWFLGVESETSLLSS